MTLREQALQHASFFRNEWEETFMLAAMSDQFNDKEPHFSKWLKATDSNLDSLEKYCVKRKLTQDVKDELFVVWSEVVSGETDL